PIREPNRVPLAQILNLDAAFRQLLDPNVITGDETVIDHASPHGPASLDSTELDGSLHLQAIALSRVVDRNYEHGSQLERGSGKHYDSENSLEGSPYRVPGLGVRSAEFKPLRPAGKRSLQAPRCLVTSTAHRLCQTDRN